MVRVSSGHFRAISLGLALAFSFGAIAAETVSLRSYQETMKGKKLGLVEYLVDPSFSQFQDLDVQIRMADGSVRKKMVQKYKGLPVEGHTAIVVLNDRGEILRLHGYMAKGVEADLTNLEPSITQEQAFKIAQNLHLEVQKVTKNLEMSRVETSKAIYIHKKSKAKLVYKVSFYSDLKGGGQPSKPIVMVDAHSSDVLSYIDSLAFESAKATGPGGNEKTGEYQYGKDYPELSVTQSGETCKLETENVTTIDLQNKGSGNPQGDSGLPTTAFEFTCPENTHKAINGAFSPLNDAHAFGTVVFNMYQDWYGINPLKKKLTLRVHYGEAFENAFWDGEQMTFGDGKDMFYPLVVLDVTAHEVSHGFTQFNSNLTYANESGGINEAFSDMAGEAAEFYQRKENDFLVGGEIAKEKDALRYMEDPTKDGISIANVSDFAWAGDFECTLCAILRIPGICENLCTDVHHSSGIFNKAFYDIANAKGWDTKKAFDVFVRANQEYWNDSTGFVDGAKATLDAAEDLKYDTDVVKKAFSGVGIDL